MSYFNEDQRGDESWEAEKLREARQLRARIELADRLADWIEGRVEEDHPEACAGRLCICQTLAAYRASAEVLHA